MSIKKVKVTTLQKIWFVAVIEILVTLLGSFIWLTSDTFKTEIVASLTETAQVATGTHTPVVNLEQLEQIYSDGSQYFDSKEYFRAINSFLQIINIGKADYKYTLLYLIGSYKLEADIEARDVTRLGNAPENYTKALEVNSIYNKILDLKYREQPKLIPDNNESYEGFVLNLKKDYDLSTNYFKGHISKTNQPDWWKAAIEPWEIVYNLNPNYLISVPDLSIGVRLTDSYKTKSIYYCRVLFDYGGALEAINWAIDIFNHSESVVRSKLDRRSLENLYFLINQTQCQAG